MMNICSTFSKSSHKGIIKTSLAMISISSQDFYDMKGQILNFTDCYSTAQTA
jgi:hypothetical protein